MAIDNDDFTRIVAPKPASVQEEALERALRPKVLDEYVGQEKIRGQLSIFIEAARKRRESLDHVLLFGPPGLGKTTLSHIIAHELGVNLRQTSGPVLERPGDLAALLTNLEPNDVLSIACSWDMSDRDEVTRFGEGTGDEMCLAALYVSW